MEYRSALFLARLSIVKDLWDSVGMYPDTWDDVRRGGAKIKKKHNVSLGLGLASEIDTNMALRSIMYSFGSSVQDEDGNVILNSKETLEAIKFVKAMYQESMTPDVFTWDASSNNRLILTGKGSLTMNAISITRTAEKDYPEMAKKIWLAKAPEGPVRRMGLQHVMNVYSIWKFAENIEGAKKFIVDYVSNFDRAFTASEFYNFPCFPKSVPDLKQQVAYDQHADPPDKVQGPRRRSRLGNQHWLSWLRKRWHIGNLWCVDYSYNVREGR